ncbi:class I SAM-dependent methyltransferase [Runella slithyformis]|uniref:Methyltransferase type 11 n=1 Tax=Runella slithyformis (strain ATCC 29530 / DSM 19594 / LMG 11500 / NCIMB 11436 / LSU 4) TaxID=761193 RepID=A0A7U3ZPV5_RUNSL|nr:class I SAM-dependent methyltransferase [Runella slithyformis]AEI51184.1 Methyltransferase type 11 [Runella slithyformis DSM 19594]
MNLLTATVDLFNRKVLRRHKDRWNYQYNLGRWESLGDIHELSRFSVIAGYAQFLKPNGKILEIGAGEGYLQQRFDKSKYSLYYSTDVSDVAINNGKKHEDDKTKYLVADMNTYVPDQKFDLIIINEAIYYGSSVDKVLTRFNPFLAENGLFIVSINGDERNAEWHQMMENSKFPKLDGTKVTTSRNTFYITVLQKI